jgi:hypothetical protein
MSGQDPHGMTDTPAEGEKNALLTALRAGEEFVEEPAAQPTPASRFLSARWMVIVGVLLVGGALLWGMRQYARSSGMKVDLVVSRIDYDPAARRGRTTAEQERVLADLQQSTGRKATGGDNIDKNPFKFNEMVGTKKETVAVADPDADARRAQEAHQKRLAEIDGEFSRLRLAGILQGRVPLARINGRTVKVGDRVGEFFLVGEISERHVVLFDVEERQHELSLATHR